MDYKEKLEEAKRLYETANADQRYVLESLFPELKESEDERIRKTLIDYFNTCAGDYYGELKLDSIIAWLEKQGECHISHDDKIMIKQLTEYFTTGHGLQNTNETFVTWLNDVKEKLEKQGEQNPCADPNYPCTNPQMDCINCPRKGDGTYSITNSNIKGENKYENKSRKD